MKVSSYVSYLTLVIQGCRAPLDEEGVLHSLSLAPPFPSLDFGDCGDVGEIGGRSGVAVGTEDAWLAERTRD